VSGGVEGAQRVIRAGTVDAGYTGNISGVEGKGQGKGKGKKWDVIGSVGSEGEKEREEKKVMRENEKGESATGKDERNLMKVTVSGTEKKVETGEGIGTEEIGTNIKKKKTKIVERFGRKETPSFWKPKFGGTSDWLTFRPGGNWVWWVVAGYSVSVLVFRLVDWVNGIVVPVKWFEGASRNIVSQMVAPEGNDVIALLIGAVAPCLSAPLWEEIFYR
jgi:hypothetical protein